MQITASYFVTALHSATERVDFIPGDLVLFPDAEVPTLGWQAGDLNTGTLARIEYCIIAFDWARIVDTKTEIAQSNSSIQFFVHDFKPDNGVRIVDNAMMAEREIQMRQYELSFLLDNHKFRGIGWQFIN